MDVDIDSDEFWDQSYKLKKGAEGRSVCPHFLRPILPAILHSGKSLILLKRQQNQSPRWIFWSCSQIRPLTVDVNAITQIPAKPYMQVCIPYPEKKGCEDSQSEILQTALMKDFISITLNAFLRTSPAYAIFHLLFHKPALFASAREPSGIVSGANCEDDMSLFEQCLESLQSLLKASSFPLPVLLKFWAIRMCAFTMTLW